MSSHRLSKLRLPRFTKINVARVLSDKSRQQSKNNQYQSLEPKNLLTADIGLSFTSITGAVSNANPPNIAGAVGENHIVQLSNDRFGIFDKDTGAELQSGSLNAFFAAARDNTVGGATLSQPRLVYDSGFDRWYAIAVGNEDLDPNVPLIQGNSIHIIGSDTSDPTGTWRGGSFQLDQMNRAVDANGNPIFQFGTERINLSIDEVGLTISSQEFFFNPLLGRQEAGTATIALPQVALFGGSIETGRAEVTLLNPTAPDANGIGFDVQFGFDTTIEDQSFPVTSQQSVFGLAIDGDPAGTADPDGQTFPFGREGDELILSEFTRNGVPNVNLDFQLGNITRIPIPFYREPDVVRQPQDILRDRDATILNASVTQEGRFLYAAHTARAGADNFGANSHIRWYVVDTVSGTLHDSGIIEAATDDLDYINPSIDVSPNGTVAIGFTATGLNVNPSSFVALGTPSAGLESPLVFNDAVSLRDGENFFIDPGNNRQNHFWGRYTTTVVDPFEPNRFWTFQQYATADNDWAVEVTNVGPSEINPVVDAVPADLDNIIVIEQDGDNIEVTIDGTLSGVFDSSALSTLTVNGNGGFDQFFVRVDDLFAPEISGSFILNGDGDDTFTYEGSTDNLFQFNVGAGGDVNDVNVNNGRILASGFVQFTSGDGNDRFQFPTANYDIDVFGGDGNDTFVADQNITGDLAIRGQVGDDTYNIAATSLPAVDLLDSIGGGEVDTLVSTGTDGQDVIEVTDNALLINGIAIPFDDALNNFGIEDFSLDALADDDIFNVSTTTRGVALFGNRGNDTFNVVETTATTGVAQLVIDAGTGSGNVLNVTQNDALPAGFNVVGEDIISGFTSSDIEFTATGGSFTGNGISIFGSDSRSDLIEVQGLLAANDLIVDGRGGDDELILNNVIDGFATFVGGAGNDRFDTNINAVFQATFVDTVDAELDVLDLELTNGDDTILVNQDGTYVFNGLSYPSGNAGFTGIEDFQINGGDGNDTFTISNTTTVANFFGGDGDDVFNVTESGLASGVSEFLIDGGRGANQLFAVRSEIFAGATVGTELVIENNRVTGITAADINFQATDGVFSLVELTGSNLDDVFRIQGVNSGTLLEVLGGAGDDTIDVASGVQGNVNGFGQGGNDSNIIRLNASVNRVVNFEDIIGSNRVDVFFDDSQQDIVVDDAAVVGNSITYQLGGSVVNYDRTFDTVALHALGGNDRYQVITSDADDLILAGGFGDDVYDIGDVFGGTTITIIDTVDGENDRLTVTGTDGDDIFDITEDSFLINGSPFIDGSGGATNIVGIESLEVLGLGGDDTFNVTSATRGFGLDGGAGNDRFVIHDTAVDAGSNNLEIEGGTGVNTIDIQRIEGTPRAAVIEEGRIRGVANAAILYTATGGSFEDITIRGVERAEPGSDPLPFLDAFLVFGLLPENSLRLLGGLGNDFFRVAPEVAGDVFLDGQDGRDRYVGLLSETQTRRLDIADSGTDGSVDRINAFLTENSDVVTINGNELRIFNDVLSFQPTIETIQILAGEGDDLIEVVQAFNVANLQIQGQSGDDRLIANGVGGIDNLILIGDNGNDTLELLESADSGFVSVFGNAGADTIRVSEDFFRDGFVDGGFGSDRYEISFADLGDRRLQVFDFGDADNDTAQIRLTDTVSNVTVRASGFTSPTQLITTSRRLESIELVGTSGQDIVTMFAAPSANTSINTGTGADILNLFSNNGAENLDIDLGAQGDTANIIRTAVGTNTNIVTGRDNDLVNIGSTAAADNGNLGTLQGALAIDLGLGSDRLFVSDSASNGGFGYTLTDTSFRNRDETFARPAFLGVDFINAEFLQFRAPTQNNFVSVTPSNTVRFIVDGNSLVNRLFIPGGNDGRELFEFGDNEGIWSFDAFRDIQFRNFFNI